MSDLIVYILELYSDIKHWFRVRKRRKFEKENNLPKKRMLLEAEKKQFVFYPTELKTIIRNNPLRKNITLDGWKNEFIYTISKDSLNYELISLGKDGKLNTSDDIKVTN